MEILYSFLNFSKQFKTRFFVMESRFRTSDTKDTAPRKTAGQRVAFQRIYMKVFTVAEDKKQECKYKHSKTVQGSLYSRSVKCL
jgi:hypothetical protein